jgi:cobalt/nickel transport system ATP-binding protein
LHTEPAIEARALSYCYPGGSRALDAIDLRIEPGERVGIVGPNGAGKTTLFLCLAGVLSANPGAVRVAGLDPADPNERRRLPNKLGVVFAISDDQLFHASVREDVAFGPLNLGLPIDEVRARTDDALAHGQLTELAHRPPHQLSEGEKRRAALAGVLAMKPEILLLDEPSIFLDPRGRRELLDVLNRWSGTGLIATHDLEFVRQACCRVLVMDGGKLVADGTTDAILGDGSLMMRHGLEVPGSLRGNVY